MAAPTIQSGNDGPLWHQATTTEAATLSVQNRLIMAMSATSFSIIVLGGTVQIEPARGIVTLT